MTLSTYAAFTAAGISLLNLIVTTLVVGRREATKWAREEMTESFYMAIDASCRVKEAVAEIRRLPAAIESEEKIAEERAAIDSSIKQLRERLTHLRLLASTDVVEAANELRSQVERLADTGSNLACSEAHYSSILVDLRSARSTLLAAAKDELRLPRSRSDPHPPVALSPHPSVAAAMRYDPLLWRRGG